MLTFKLSEVNTFRCSACEQEIGSLGNGRFVIGGIADLIAIFKIHVEQNHRADGP